MSGAGPALSILAGIVYAVILAPIIVVVTLAFSVDNYIVFPPSGFRRAGSLSSRQTRRYSPLCG